MYEPDWPAALDEAYAQVLTHLRELPKRPVDATATLADPAAEAVVHLGPVPARPG
jgi:hypothetical protein